MDLSESKCRVGNCVAYYLLPDQIQTAIILNKDYRRACKKNHLYRIIHTTKSQKGFRLDNRTSIHVDPYQRGSSTGRDKNWRYGPKHDRAVRVDVASDSRDDMQTTSKHEVMETKKNNPSVIARKEEQE